MRAAFSIFLLGCVPALAGTPIIVYEVQAALASGDQNRALNELKLFRTANGTTPEYVEALSWVGRAALARRDFTAADANASEVLQLCLTQLKRRKLDADASLPNALGASIEVRALSDAQEGRRDEAVLFLREELRHWNGTSIQNRIQKNLNLLTLEGKPAPLLDLAQAVTKTNILPISAHRGHPVLLFFWAHWCSDCKQEIAVIEKMEQKYARAGLVVIAPTQHYGYAAGGADVPRDTETKYIRGIWDRYYAGLGAVETPLSEKNFASYGVSTTPTLVLVDRNGIVRMYNPGALSEDQLSGRIAAVSAR